MIIVAAVWISGVLHPGLGLLVAFGSLIWLAVQYDNHTGSILFLTLLFLFVLFIIVALLMLMVARASA